MKNILHTQRGISIIEMIVVSSVIGTVMLMVLGTLQNTIQLSQRSIERVQASMLLEEGVEVVKLIRNTAWSTISGMTNNTTYYPTWNGAAWSLSTTPSTIDNKYTRTVVFSSVYRDGQAKIATSGTLDAGTKKVVVTITWQTADQQFSTPLTFYVSNIF